MPPILVTFFLTQVLPLVIQEVIKNLPAIFKFLAEYHPDLNTQAISGIRKQIAKDQGPGFDWHSGP